MANTFHTGIYAIENLVNGRSYVGSAVRFSKRWKEHVRTLERGTHHSRFLQREWSQFGADAFRFTVLLVCSPASLLMYEQAFIDFYLPEYNVNPTAGSMLGFKHSAESRRKMSDAAKRTKNFTGKNHSAESKARIAAAKIGETQHRDHIEKRMRTTVERHGKHPAKRRFTEYDVKLIRQRVATGEPQAYFAAFYRVGSSVISEICTRKTYGWIE